MRHHGHRTYGPEPVPSDRRDQCINATAATSHMRFAANTIIVTSDAIVSEMP